MRIADSVALVTGAGRGLGRAFVQELAGRGARAVYAAARDPSAVTGPGIPVALDITDPEQVAGVARDCADVTLLVNNAGVMTLSPLIGAPTMAGARQEIGTNYLGTLAMCRAFAPVLAANGGGAIVNMLSVVSFFTNPANGSYGASKAAEWALTNGIRIELARRVRRRGGTQAISTPRWPGTWPGARRRSAPPTSPGRLPTRSRRGRSRSWPTTRTRRIKSLLPDDHEKIYPDVQAAWHASHPPAEPAEPR